MFFVCEKSHKARRALSTRGGAVAALGGYPAASVLCLKVLSLPVFQQHLSISEKPRLMTDRLIQELVH